MNSSEEPLFESTGKISLMELNLMYPGMSPGDIVLKFAEYKNFDAAKASFKTWDERSIFKAANLLRLNFKLEEDLYATRDKYIAVVFLKKLITDWEHDHEQGAARSIDPGLPNKATELLAIRKKGVLPHIDLAGTDFTIDWRLRQLRETAEPWKNISFEEMDMAESGEEYLFFFNIQTHELYMPAEDITELPGNVVVLEIPYELKLDPVAVAREYHLNEAEFLLENPIQESLTAKVIPISESGLPELIDHNLKMTNSQANNDRHRPKKGR